MTRDLTGDRIFSLSANWVEQSQRIIFHDDTFWSLGADTTTHRLWLSRVNLEGVETDKVIAPQPYNSFGDFRVLLDPSRKLLWLGFTAGRPGLSYAPIVENYNWGTQKTFGWNPDGKGRLFDAIIDLDGSLLMARDVPSDSGFTVPFYSHLERISIEGVGATYYQSDLNYFIESAVPTAQKLFMIQRSIFGSDGSYLVEWDRRPGEIGERLFRLPGSAKKLFVCKS